MTCDPTAAPPSDPPRGWHLDALTALMRDGLLRLPDEPAAFGLVTARVAATLRVQRASVWRVTPSRDAIVCRDLFDASRGTHTTGLLVFRESCPAYFSAIESSDVIPAHDALTDPCTSAMAEAYLRPLGIVSMLDAPIVADDMVQGLLCLEHTTPRIWSLEEQSFVVACANLLSLWLAQRGRADSEAALRAARRQNALILEAVREGIHGIDAGGRITFENATATAILGWLPGEMLGRPAHVLMHRHGPDGGQHLEHECPVHRTLRDGEVRHVANEVFFRKDGSRVPVEYTCAPVREERGTITGAVVSFRDVAERRRLETLQEAESRILRMIASGATLTDILHAVVANIEVLAQDLIAAILLVDADGCLRYAVAPHLPQGFVAAVDGLPIAGASEACGTEAYRRASVIVSDVATDGLWIRDRQQALAHGLRACWAMPVLGSDRTVVATLALYAREVRDASVSELALMRRAADMIGIALERRRQDDAVRASEARFQSVARATADVICDWDLGSGALWWSEDVETTLGYPRETLPPGIESWRDHVHPQDAGRVTQSLDAAIARRDAYWSEQYRFLHADGRTLDIEDSGCLLTTDDGLPSRFVRGMTNITARTASQRALGERLKELRCLYRVVDLTTRRGQSVDAICAEIASILPDSLQFPKVAAARVVVEGHVHAWGDWDHVIATLGAVIGTEDAVVGTVDVGYTPCAGVTDGDGPFLAEERSLIDAVATHISRMIIDRQMLDTLTRSERLRAVGELTGGVAHDFNNLLQVVLGNAELLAEALHDHDDLRSLADTTKQAAERGAELTRHLLAFARQQPLQPRPTDIDALLAGMQALLKRSLGEDMHIELMPGARSALALVDPVQLESAVLNLCINARDAMPDGGRITIATEIAHARVSPETPQHTGGTGAWITVDVVDTGSGMSTDVLQRAFDPFFTTKDVGRGSGLGLSMVYGFIKQSGGHISIDSKPSEGTTVRLHLPRTTGPAAAVIAAPPALESRGGAESILIVEDNEPVREQAEALLRGLGYRVVCASSGADALECLSRAGHIDLLFTDVVMPGGMSGRQLADAARVTRPGMAVLFASGYSESEVIQNGRLEPGVQLIAKPYRRQELAAKVRQVLDAAVGDANRRSPGHRLE